VRLEFDGISVSGNFDSGALSGVIDWQLQRQLERDIDPRHRGLNLPLQQLAECDFQIDTLQHRELVPPFLSFETGFQIAALLEECRRHMSAQDLLFYRPGIPVADLVNRCIAAGFSHHWALNEDDVAHLVFGEVPQDVIP
jgi:hypothetical protein